MLLRRRPQVEQRAILMLRGLAGTGHDRSQGREDVLAMGGTGTTIIPLARLVGAALALGLEIRAPAAPYVSADELALLAHLTNRQRFIGRRPETTDQTLSVALSEAAQAFDAIGLRFPPLTLGIRLVEE